MKRGRSIRSTEYLCQGVNAPNLERGSPSKNAICGDYEENGENWNKNIDSAIIPLQGSLLFC